MFITITPNMIKGCCDIVSLWVCVHDRQLVLLMSHITEISVARVVETEKRSFEFDGVIRRTRM